jgi:hypothetical protein
MGGALRLHLVDQRPKHVDIGLKEIANQYVSDIALEFGVLPDETPEAESVIKNANELPHAFHSHAEFVFPFAKLSRGRVASLKALGDRIRGHLA